MTMSTSITPLRAVTAPKARPKKPPAKPTIKRHAGIVDQVRVALSREHRLATCIGALLGAVVPFATFMVAHYELDLAQPWLDPRALLVLGGLLFSARTVYQWGKMALGSGLKAFGFTVLLEGIMVASSQPWLAVVALVYLCAINAIATGTTLARGASAIDKPAAEVVS